MDEPIQKNAAAAENSQSKLSLAINLFTSPTETFAALKHHPSKLFPLLLIAAGNALVMFWYFNIVDYSWYIDDVIAGLNLEADQIEDTREGMEALSRTTMMGFALLGGFVGIFLMFLLQTVYLSLVAALRGDQYKFGHWFSLVCWSGLPFLLSAMGMAVTILLSPNGQLSVYDLDPLALRNLGMVSNNESVQSLYNSVSLSMLWSLALILIGFNQWTGNGWFRSSVVVFAPYAAILGIWAYFALA